MNQHQVVYVDPYSLKSHEVNQSIYRDAPDEQFLESVKSLGILEPLLGWKQDDESIVVLSGHRRMNAARMLQIETVPVIVQQVESNDEAIRMLILSNRQRDKTNEQMAREYGLLQEVEERLAQVRMHHKTESGEQSDESGRSKQIAAKAVGMDYRTAEKAQLVIEAMDDADAAGDVEKVEDLRKKLNRSVNKGHSAVVRDRQGILDGLKHPVPKSLENTFSCRKRLNGLIFKLGEVKASVRVLSESEGGELLSLREIEADCNNAAQAMTAAKPHAVCPICKGGECASCDQLGWMHKDQYEALPKGLRSKE